MIGMPILPVWDGHRSWPCATNQLHDAADVVGRRANRRDRAAPDFPSTQRRELCEPAPLPSRVLRAYPLLAISPRVRSHRPDRVAERRVFGERAAETDLEIIGMRAERHEIDPAHSRMRVNEKDSSPLSGCP